MNHPHRSLTRKSTVISALFLIGLAATACSSGSGTGTDTTKGGTSGETQGKASDKHLTLGVLTGPFTISTTLVEARDGMLARAKELGNVTIKVAVGDGAPAQLNAMRTLVSQGVDAILIDPADDKGIIPGVMAANDAGIPVIGWVGRSAGGKMAGQVSFNENQGGTDITTWAIKHSGESGDITLLQGTKSHPAGRAREEAFRTVLSSYPDMKLTGYAEANWLQDVAYKDTQNFLTRDPGLKAIVAFTDEMGIGALKAVGERNLGKQVVITGYNGNCAGLKSVWSGGLSATLYQPWADAGRSSVDIAVGLLRGEAPKTEIILPSLVIDKPIMEGIIAGTQDATAGATTSIKAAVAGCK